MNMTTISEAIESVRLSGYEYAQQASKPAWYAALEKDKPEGFILASATSGSSPFNEWYVFASREEFVRVASGFTSQSFTDHFYHTGDEIFHIEDVEAADDGEPTIKAGANPADVSDVIRSESRF